MLSAASQEFVINFFAKSHYIYKSHLSICFDEEYRVACKKSARIDLISRF